MPVHILGINAFHGDAAAAIIRDGKIVAAVEEERFNRIKHCAGFPAASIRYCLKAAGIDLLEVDHVGISRNPSAHLHKKLLYAATRAVRQIGAASSYLAPSTGSVMDSLTACATLNGGNHANGNGKAAGTLQTIKDRLDNAARVRDLKMQLARVCGVSEKNIKSQFHYIEHHRAHLASSFLVSPFARAALLSIDGFGDFVSTMWAHGEGNQIQVLGQVEYPHSVGIVYTATTQFLGFPHYGDEGKVMGLAPYGRPRFIKEFRKIIQLGSCGHFRIDLDYFRHHSEGVEMNWEDGSPAIGRIYSDAFVDAFGFPRLPGAPLTERDRDIAASLQLRVEEVAFHVLAHLYEETLTTNLGLSGGVAYNSVMNGKIILHTPFKRVFVQPAAGDSGTALGVCLEINNRLLGYPRLEVMKGPYTGPHYSNEEIESELKSVDLRYELLRDHELPQRAAKDVADGLVVGWFQGQMEFGPRALGNRSILADPRRGEMMDILNARIKKREPFRPFAPSILEERTGDYFQQTHPAPAMLMVHQIRPERQNEIPAVTHVDGSGRLQTVSRESNPRFYELIFEFYKLTGVPIVLNTSFNENEPIVCTPRDAIECFLKTKMEVLYMGNWCIRRE